MVMEEGGQSPNGIITFTRDDEDWSGTGTILLLVPEDGTLVIVNPISLTPYNVGDTVECDVLASGASTSVITNDEGTTFDQANIAQPGSQHYEHVVSEEWLGRETEGFRQEISLDGTNTVVIMLFAVNTTAAGDDNVVPAEFSLGQNYPNPFNPETTIGYSLPERSNVTIEIFNIKGQKMLKIIKAQESAGNHEITIKADSWASGTYFYRVSTENFSSTKKMLLLK